MPVSYKKHEKTFNDLQTRTTAVKTSNIDESNYVQVTPKNTLDKYVEDARNCLVNNKIFFQITEQALIVVHCTSALEKMLF